MLVVSQVNGFLRFLPSICDTISGGDMFTNQAISNVLQILKDITNRYKLLCGHRVSYVPGWDCHGMPIEQKALAEARADHKTMQPLEIRKKGECPCQTWLFYVLQIYMYTLD